MPSLSRFYQQGELVTGNTVALDRDVSHHIHRVLRLKTDQQIQLFNGDGHNYQALITSIGKIVHVDILRQIPAIKQSSVQIHLGQAISKGERMDFTLQKTVEVGVNSITPIFSQRVQFRFDEKRIERKMQHWRKIIISATEQSGRAHLPTLNNPITLQQWLESSNDTGLLLHPEATTGLMDIAPISSLRLLVGPEGGLSDQEVAMTLDDPAFTAIQLGPRILRTETAALVAISILQARFGDI